MAYFRPKKVGTNIDVQIARLLRLEGATGNRDKTLSTKIYEKRNEIVAEPGEAPALLRAVLASGVFDIPRLALRACLREGLGEIVAGPGEAPGPLRDVKSH